MLACRVDVHGRSAHGSTPWLGDNAVLKAIDVFRRIESLPFSRESSELFDRPSINLGRIQGGDALNKVPDLCTMVVDIRYLPNQDPADILEQIRAIPDIEVVRTFRRVPAYVSRANPYVLALVDAVGPAHQGRVDERRARRRVRRRVVPAGGHPRGRVRARPAPATTARRSGSRSPRSPTTARRCRTSCATCRRGWTARTAATVLRAVEGGPRVRSAQGPGEEKPPRLGRGLLLRGLLAGVM